MPQSTCCCCFQLRCGAITIGVLLLINHGLETLAGIMAVIAVNRVDNVSDYDFDDTGVEAIAYSALTVNGVWLILDILLLRGIAAERPPLVLAWLCWGLPMSVLMAAAAIALVCLAARYLETGFVVTASVILFDYLVLLYWAVVVLTYYRAMKAAAQQRAGQAAPAPILAYGRPTLDPTARPNPAVIRLDVTAMEPQQPTWAPYQPQRNPMSYQQQGNSMAQPDQWGTYLPRARAPVQRY